MVVSEKETKGEKYLLKLENELKNDTIALKKIMKWAKNINKRIIVNVMELNKCNFTKDPENSNQKLDFNIGRESQTSERLSSSNQNSKHDAHKDTTVLNIENQLTSLEVELNQTLSKYNETVTNYKNLNKTRQKENSTDSLLKPKPSFVNKNSRIQSYFDNITSKQQNTIEHNIDVTQIEKCVQLAIKDKLTELNGKCDELETKFQHSVSKNADIISNLSNELGLINMDLKIAYNFLQDSKEDAETRQAEINEQINVILKIFKNHYK